MRLHRLSCSLHQMHSRQSLWSNAHAAHHTHPRCRYGYPPQPMLCTLRQPPTLRAVQGSRTILSRTPSGQEHTLGPAAHAGRCADTSAVTPEMLKPALTLACKP